MAKKGSKILIAVLVVALLYIFGLLLITSPGFQAAARKRIDKKAAAEKALSEDDLLKMIQEAAAADGKIEIGPPVDAAGLAREIVDLVDQEGIAESAASKIDYDAVARKVSEKIEAARPRQPEEQTVRKVMKAVLDAPEFEAQITGAVESQTESVERMLSDMFASDLVSEMILSALRTDSKPIDDYLSSWLAANLPSQTAPGPAEGSGAQPAPAEAQANAQAGDEDNLRRLEALVDEKLSKEAILSALDSHPERLEGAVGSWMAEHGGLLAERGTATEDATAEDATVEDAAAALDSGQVYKTIASAIQSNPVLLENAVGNWIAANKEALVDILADEVARSESVGALVAHAVEDNAPFLGQELSMMLDSDLIPQMIVSVVESDPDLLRAAIDAWFEENKAKPSSGTGEAALKAPAAASEAGEAAAKAPAPTGPAADAKPAAEAQPAPEAAPVVPEAPVAPEAPEAADGGPNAKTREVFTIEGQDRKLDWEEYSKRKKEPAPETGPALEAPEKAKDRPSAKTRKVFTIEGLDRKLDWEEYSRLKAKPGQGLVDKTNPGSGN